MPGNNTSPGTAGMPGNITSPGTAGMPGNKTSPGTDGMFGNKTLISSKRAPFSTKAFITRLLAKGS